MQDRDLIVGVLAAQAGFATPSQVLTAAAARLFDAASDSLLTRLEQTGALTPERRKLLEALAEQALAARKGDARAVATALGGAPALFETLVSATGGAPAEAASPRSVGPDVPLERPGQAVQLARRPAPAGATRPGRLPGHRLRAFQEDHPPRPQALERDGGRAPGPDERSGAL